MMGQETTNYVDKTSKESSNVNVVSSDIMIPIDSQSRLSQTIRTHNGISVGASGSNISSAIKCEGFDTISVFAQSDSSMSWGMDIQWSDDGINVRGLENNVLPNNGVNSKIAIVDVKAPYCFIKINNADTAPHIMSAWAYLKV